MEYPVPDQTTPMPKRFQIAQIIGFAFLGSIGMYALLVFIIKTGGQPPQPIDPTFRTLLWVVGLGAMAAGPNLMEKICPRPSTTNDFTVFTYMQTKMILKLASIETGAIMGLVIFFLTMTWKDFAILASVAAALMLTQLPTRNAWENEARTFGLDWTLR